MPGLAIVLGITLLLAVVFDVLVTTLTLGGSGPLTKQLSRWLWNITLRVHHLKPNHQLLVTMGWIVLVGVAILWFALTWVGWILIFSANQDAIINATSQQPANFVERIYFTGYVLSTLGMGDYQPQGAIWQLVTALASINGFFLFSLAIAYLLPVVSAAIQKRQLAVYISTLGGTADEIISRAWNGKDLGQFDQHLIALTPLLSAMGENYLTYPILHYFHSEDRFRSLGLSVTALDEALTLLRYGVKTEHQPDRAAIAATRRASSAFLMTVRAAYLKKLEPHEPPLPSLDALRQMGIRTVSDHEFWVRTRHLQQRRRLLLTLIKSDGWAWHAVASQYATHRARNLDDTEFEGCVERR